MKIKEKTIDQFSKYTDEQLKKGALNVLFMAIGVFLFLCFIFLPLALIVGGYLFYQYLIIKSVIKELKIRKETPVDNIANVVELRTQAESEIQENKKIQNNESQKDYNLFETVKNDSLLCYKYEKNICLSEGAINLVTGNGGKFLNFMKEPENEFDKNAIALYLDSQKIGYVYKGNTQNMLNDWIKKGYEYLGYINKIHVEENKATFKIGFYKPLSEFTSKTYQLLKTSKRIDEFETRADNFSTISEGDTAEVEFDYDTGRYFVYDEIGSEIGELTDGATDFINSNKDKNIIGVITDFVYDDKPKAKITLYLVP